MVFESEVLLSTLLLGFLFAFQTDLLQCVLRLIRFKSWSDVNYSHQAPNHSERYKTDDGCKDGHSESEVTRDKLPALGHSSGDDCRGESDNLPPLDGSTVERRSSKIKWSDDFETLQTFSKRSFHIKQENRTREMCLNVKVYVSESSHASSGLLRGSLLKQRSVDSLSMSPDDGSSCSASAFKSVESLDALKAIISANSEAFNSDYEESQKDLVDFKYQPRVRTTQRQDFLVERIDLVRDAPRESDNRTGHDAKVGTIDRVQDNLVDYGYEPQTDRAHHGYLVRHAKRLQEAHPNKMDYGHEAHVECGSDHESELLLGASRCPPMDRQNLYERPVDKVDYGYDTKVDLSADYGYEPHTDRAHHGYRARHAKRLREAHPNKMDYGHEAQVECGSDHESELLLGASRCPPMDRQNLYEHTVDKVDYGCDTKVDHSADYGYEPQAEGPVSACSSSFDDEVDYGYEPQEMGNRVDRFNNHEQRESPNALSVSASTSSGPTGECLRSVVEQVAMPSRRTGRRASINLSSTCQKDWDATEGGESTNHASSLTGITPTPRSRIQRRSSIGCSPSLSLASERERHNKLTEVETCILDGGTPTIVGIPTSRVQRRTSLGWDQGMAWASGSGRRLNMSASDSRILDRMRRANGIH